MRRGWVGEGEDFFLQPLAPSARRAINKWRQGDRFFGRVRTGGRWLNVEGWGGDRLEVGRKLCANGFLHGLVNRHNF